VVSHAQESPGVGKATADKALHLTAIPLRYIASVSLVVMLKGRGK